MKIYHYKNCSTCKKSLRFFKEKSVDFKDIPIRETPPSKSELKKMLKAHEDSIKKLFNTSGQDYRELKIKDKLATMTSQDAIELLSSNGNLIKRPFIIAEDFQTVGYKPEVWENFT